MAKRFTDSNKWDHGWFRKLKPKFKCAWFYILDKCDNAGIYLLDFEAMSFHIGEDINQAEFESLFGEKLSKVDSDKYIINSFVEFQYGELSEKNNAHKSVISKLSKLGPHEPLMSPSSGAQDKDKDKEQDKEMDMVKEKDKDVLEFFEFWNSFDLLPKAKSLSSQRKAKIRKRLSEAAFDYQKALPIILESDFLMGRSSDWKITFDWFIENDSNYIKVLEGNYSRKGQQSKDHFKDHFEAQAKRLEGNV